MAARRERVCAFGQPCLEMSETPMRNEGPLRGDEQLEDLLRTSRPEPALPPRFREGVWREIERLEIHESVPSGFVGWAERLVNVLLRPRCAAVAALVLILAGTAAGIVFGTSSANEAARARM